MLLSASSSTRAALAAAASTSYSSSSRSRLISNCRPAARSPRTATAAATTRRNIGAGLIAIGVAGSLAGFPRGAAAKASRPDVENVSRGVVCGRTEIEIRSKECGEEKGARTLCNLFKG